MCSRFAKIDYGGDTLRELMLRRYFVF